MKRRSYKILSLVLAGILLLLIVVRLLAPPLILKNLNKKLAELSPVYSLHIESLGLSVWRMAYRLEGVTGHLKKANKQFASIDSVDVSISWSALFHGRILTDVEIINARLELSPKLLKSPKDPDAHPRSEAEQAAKTLFPVRIASVSLRSSRIRFGEFLSAPDEPLWSISQLDGVITNLNPVKTAPLTFFTLRGTLIGDAVVKLVGKAKRLTTPLPWEVDAEVRGFDLKKANPLFVKYVPLSFEAGHLDLFSEIKSEGGKLEGYVKPFFKKIHVLGDKKDFKGLKHFAVELVTGLGNIILRRSDNHSLASRIEFEKIPGESLNIRTKKAIATAIENGFGKPLAESIDNSININDGAKDVEK